VHFAVDETPQDAVTDEIQKPDLWHDGEVDHAEYSSWKDAARVGRRDELKYARGHGRYESFRVQRLGVGTLTSTRWRTTVASLRS